MFLTEKHSSPFSSFFFPQIPKIPPPNSFEQTLIARLNSLPPFPDSIPLSYLSRFIDLLTLTLTDLTAVISSPSISVTDRPALSSHLNSSISLLDSCNAISAAADRILHRCLLVRLALRLVSSSKLPRARSAIAEWRAADRSPSGPTDLRRMRPGGPNGGRKATAVRRAIYAVEAISDLVVGLAHAFLGGRGGFLVGVLVPGDFVWGAAYNEVAGKVLGVRCGEIGVVERSVEKLGVAVAGDGGGGGGVAGGLRDAARGAEEAVEELTEGMDGLGKAVGALFRSGLESREAALRCFRVWNEGVFKEKL